tara:strand:- start:29748 stop:31883 length:2136 start_codon:yes stop_codon:yes gene_type:complete
LKRLKIISLGILISFEIHSSINDYLPPDPGPTAGNFSETGLFDMPTARLMSEGSLKFGISSFSPYEVTGITATPFSWLEATFRYTEVKNQLYGPAFYSGNQTFKDKSFDFKFRLIKERNYLPSIALGLRDIAGTGVFASEYLVASKRFGNFDATLGIGWGQMATEGNIKNPFISLDEGFGDRNKDYGGLGGDFNFGQFFSGQNAAIFGGFEYLFPRYGIRFKAEYDTSDQSNAITPLVPIEVDSKINYGISYSLGKWADINLGYQRGNTFQFSIFFKGDYSDKALVPKLDKPVNIGTLRPDERRLIRNNKRFFYSTLLEGLKQEEIYLHAATREENKLSMTINQSKFRSYAMATGRAARIASALSNSDVEIIEIYHLNGNPEMAKVSLARAELDKAIEGKISPTELLLTTDFSSPYPQHIKNADFVPRVILPDFLWSMGPALRNHIGGPEAFYLGQLWWKINTNLIIRRGLSLSTVLGVNIVDNFNEFNNPSYSELPHVRSDIQSYLYEGRTNIARMKLDYIWTPYEDIFARIDVGLIEEMFGGFGGEILYRPFGKRYALGVVAHKVRQREYRQRFGFRDYKTTTGHLEMFYEFANGINASLLAGKYLAGDKGVTLDLSRRFISGFRLGVYASKTNVPAEIFGEGTFDKGFYFSIPTQMFLPGYETGSVSFGMSPLTKDAAATLHNHNSLWSITGNTEEYALRRDWRTVMD